VIPFYIVKLEKNNTYVACTKGNSRCVSPYSKISGPYFCLQIEDKILNMTFYSISVASVNIPASIERKITLNYNYWSNSEAVLLKAFHPVKCSALSNYAEKNCWKGFTSPFIHTVIYSQILQFCESLKFSLYAYIHMLGIMPL